MEGALQYVAKAGPTLGRPRADSIHGAHVHNLKELRVERTVRVLYAFDPNRTAVMLLGGDKIGSGNRWYRRMVAEAERLYVDHLRSIGKEDRCLSRHGAGLKSAASSR